MNILSLFDGISCGMLALNRAGILVDNYYASEIDSFSTKVSMKNFPKIIRLGDVKKWRCWTLPPIDLLLAGFPCQSFSLAGKQLNFNDPRGQLFFDTLNIIEAIKPKYFLLENVKMKKEFSTKISELLGVDYIEINSSLLSAQNRKRLYWTNIPISELPVDKGIHLCDIIEDKPSGAVKCGAFRGRYINGTKKTRQMLEIRKDQKTNTLTTVQKDNRVVYLDEGNRNRKLSVLEYERLQTLPEGYTLGVSNTQRYKMIGNGWTVDVIAHLLKGLKNEV